jgi:hypothetical protein
VTLFIVLLSLLNISSGRKRKIGTHFAEQSHGRLTNHVPIGMAIMLSC